MKKILITMSIVIIMVMLVGTTVSTAAIPISSADLYAKGQTEKLLKFNGMEVGTTIVKYLNNGVEYPAYCLNRELPGVGELPGYTVSVNEMISNVKVWRAIINGYPYKSIGELGCENEGEAFLATKQAVYCMLCNRDPNLYTPIGEAGERTLNALKQIVEAANTSNQVKMSSDLIISSGSALWKIDSENKKYISRTFEVSSNAPISGYNVSIDGELPEGIIVTDETNQEKQEFTSGEKFKILIPVLNIIEDGSFSIKVFGKVKTKPVLYGASGNSSTQDYALVGGMLEDGEGTEKVYYTKNQSKIVIIKKTDETNTLLQGVEFHLLDENQEVIRTDLVTNQNGEIILENILPGTYYIKEVKTIEGYSLYDKLIKVELDLNETANVIVNNSEKEVSIEEKHIETKVEVANSVSEQEIKVVQEKPVKLPKTGM